MKRNPTIKIFQDELELAAGFAEILIERLAYVSTGDKFSWMLSGGSTPKKIFRFIADRYIEKIDWQKTQLFWGDERLVPPDHQDSNFKMVRESLLKYIPMKKNQVFRIKGENDPVSESIRYSRLVKENVKQEGGWPVFDLVMLGLGQDGHTASIFPGMQQIIRSKALFEISEHPISKQKRITATTALINHAKEVVFIVTGPSKAAIVKSIFNTDDANEKYPASLINPQGKLMWYLDQSAASGI